MSNARPPLPAVDPTLRARARGTTAQPAPRFERHTREWMDDGWDHTDEERQVQRDVSLETPRSVIAWNQSPDLGFDRAVNPYRGCEHGCIYCYARPSHAYLGLSPGLDFETRLVARPDAAKVLERELARKSYRVAPLCLGSNTDPWQPIEATHRITRSLLDVLRDWRHPVTITTRGALIERDIDILRDMAALNLVQVGISVTTLDAKLARAMEPRAPAPTRRLGMIKALSEAGIPTRLMMGPIIPGLSDHEIEPIMQAARDAGARVAWWSLLRLPREVSPLFQDWLEHHRPGHAAKVMTRLREMRAGQDNDSAFHSRFRGQGAMADLLAQRVKMARKRLKYEDRLPDLARDLFRAPPKTGDQLCLF
ncbi:PA0069 family radical SAM protein [Pararhodobacter sp.]|uniref:PA0069 family radical SAM protein n=1 Tax=Pararhodobacter sp. TaxID=2127056 RepID=UPI002AFE6CBF|nr:PA0069 family radical SAM protein [Pararhodobacter sp.]